MDVSQLQVAIGADISAFEEAIGAIVEALGNVADSIQTMANDFLEASSHVSNSGTDMLESIGKIGGAFFSTISAGGALAISFTGLSDVVNKFGIALKANPISLIATLIAGLIAIVVECYYRFDTFRASVNAVWAIIKDCAIIIGDSLIGEFKILYDIVIYVVEVFKDLGTILKVLVVSQFLLIIDAVKALYYATVGLDWGKAWESMKQLGSDAKDAAMQVKDAAVDIAKSSVTMADNVKKDFTEAAKNITNVAKGMSDDMSKAYDDAFKKTQQVNDAKVKVNKVTITPGSIKLNTENSEVEPGEIKHDITPITAPQMSFQPPPVVSDSAQLNANADQIQGYQNLSTQIGQTKNDTNALTQSQQDLEQAITGVASGIGDAIGKLASGKNNYKEILSDMLSELTKALGDYVKKKGEVLIKAGIWDIATGNALIASSGGVNPLGYQHVSQGAGELAAGGLLTVAGAAISAIKMASGGIVSGSTFANIGEYAGASHNPEVVAPLDKLRSFIGNSHSGGHFSFELMGDKMVAALQRQSDNTNFVLGTGNQ